jgi:hypothetical protein
MTTEYEYLCTELQKQVDSKAIFIAQGNCQSYEEYKHVAGIIRGLALAIDFIQDREQKITKDNNE